MIDFTLGRAGALLGCAFLLDAFDDASLPVTIAARDELRSAGNEMLRQLWQTVDGYAAIGR